jgi:hypothetical protein
MGLKLPDHLVGKPTQAKWALKNKSCHSTSHSSPSLAAPLASMAEAGGKHVPSVSASSMSHEHKQKGDLCTVPFL